MDLNDKLEELSRERLEAFCEKQVMEWIDGEGLTETPLDRRLRKRMRFPKEYITQSKAWLTLENYRFYVERVVRVLENWDTPPKTLTKRNAQALYDLRRELKTHEQVRGKHPPEKEEHSPEMAKKREPDELHTLLALLCKSNPSYTANKVWFELKRELERRQPKYDLRRILHSFDPSQHQSNKHPHGVICWKPKKRKRPCPMCYRTLSNRLSEVKKSITP